MSSVLSRPVRSPVRTRGKRIALAGCGEVGGAFGQLVTEHTGCAISRVLVRDAERMRPDLGTPWWTTDTLDLLADDTDLLVELIGGTGVASSLVQQALMRGISVVTANKSLICAQGPALLALAHANRARLDFEGAVGGAVPIVRALRDSLASSRIVSIRGVLNGTCNFVLNQMTEQGISCAQAVGRAMAKGYAEADPSRDLNGRDTADKLGILAWLATGVEPSKVVTVVHGIDGGADNLVERARQLGGRARLIAEFDIDSRGAVAAIVEPVIALGESSFFRLPGTTNRVEVKTGHGDLLSFEGPGAGGRSTAGVVFSDLLAPTRSYEPPQTATRIVADSRELDWLIERKRMRATRANVQGRGAIRIIEDQGAH